MLVNPRNAAAGALRRLDPRETARYPLDIFFYNITNLARQTQVRTQFDVLQYLKELGLKVCPEIRQVSGYRECLQYYEEILHKKTSLDYEMGRCGLQGQ